MCNLWKLIFTPEKKKKQPKKKEKKTKQEAAGLNKVTISTCNKISLQHLEILSKCPS